MRNGDIKVSFNGEIRVLPLCDSLSNLYAQIARTFGIEKFSLKYRDADRDLITMTTDMELQHATATGVALFFEVWPAPMHVPVVPSPVQQAPFMAPSYPVQPPSPTVQQYNIRSPQSPVLHQPVSPGFQQPVSPGFQQPVSPGFQQPVSPAADATFLDKRRHKKTLTKEEWQAFKATRKAEKAQRKGVAVPVPFPNSVVALDTNKRVLLPGTQFAQSWRVRNEGTYAWPAGMLLVYDPCKKHTTSLFTGPNSVAIDRALAPGEDVVITFNLAAPQDPGRYVGLWRLATPDQWKFGKKIKVVVKVPTPDKADQALNKATRKAKLSDAEKLAFKQAKHDAKQAYWAAKKDAKVNAKQSGDKQAAKEAKRAAKQACRDAKREAKVAHRGRKATTQPCV